MALTSTVEWGKLPQDIISELYKREWLNKARRNALLKGSRHFPLTLGLKPPTNQQISQNPAYFQQFVTAWKQRENIQVRWEKRQFRSFGEQLIPTHLLIENLVQLVELLGETAQTQFQHWKQHITILLNGLPKQPNLVDLLIDHLEQIELFSAQELQALVTLIPQLKANLGEGNYLRALNVVGVETKFIEQHFQLIEDLLDCFYQGEVKKVGLLAWLNCLPKPQHWLLIKPLCNQTQQALGGIPLLRLAVDTLLHFSLPAERIIIVENEQSCLALPPVENTIAIAGAGKNLTWLEASWLKDKQIAYWGDIDADGLHILGLARQKQPHLTTLMMNEETLLQFQTKMVNQSHQVSFIPNGLSTKELALFHDLQNGKYGATRLEQERVDNGWVKMCIERWIGNIK